MLLDTRRFVTPLHQPPVLHKDALLMSFDNHWKINKIYKEIIGLNDVDHFSINVVAPNGEMSIISYSPSIIYNIFQDGSYLYNGSISPTYYKNLDTYTWEQTYDRRKQFYQKTKESLQDKNGIQTGVVMVHREHGFNILFSFATKRKNNDLLDKIGENRKDFFKMGFHCFNNIKEVYSQYYDSQEILYIKEPQIIRPARINPNFRLIK